MAVLNTTSPTERPGAPMETPAKTVPSSSARIAGGVTGGRLGGVARHRRPGIGRPGGKVVQASGNDTGADPGAPARYVNARLLEQVAQAPGTGAAAAQAHGGVQCAAREHVAVGGAMDQLDALAHAGELDEVFTDDVAGAQARVARPGTAPLRGCAQRQRRARRRVLLVYVVGFDDVAVPARKGGGGAFDQLLEHGNAEAEVRGPEHRYPRRGSLQGVALGVGEPGGARHERRAALAAQCEDRIEGFRQAEVHRDVED